MAHGKSLELAQIRPMVTGYWTPQEWGRLPGHVPGDPTQWPKGSVPRPRRERRNSKRVRRLAARAERRRNRVG